MDDRVSVRDQLLLVLSWLVPQEQRKEDPSLQIIVFDPSARPLVNEKHPLSKPLDPFIDDMVKKIEEVRREFNRSRPEYLNHLFSYRPVTEEDRRFVAERVREFSSDDPSVRDQSSHDLIAMGRPAWVALSEIDLALLDPEAKARIHDVMAELEHWNTPFADGGWDHDVAFLAGLKDPRARKRLERILSNVRPFSETGFPRDTEAQFLTETYEKIKETIRWSPRRDQYENP